MNGWRLAHETRRLGIPDLEFRGPLCPLCGRECACDGDSWWCDSCGATWDVDGMNGEGRA